MSRSLDGVLIEGSFFESSVPKQIRSFVKRHFDKWKYQVHATGVRLRSVRFDRLDGGHRVVCVVTIDTPQGILREENAARGIPEAFERCLRSLALLGAIAQGPIPLYI